MMIPRALLCTLGLATCLVLISAQSSNVNLQPSYVFISDKRPGSATCKVMNSARLPFYWNGITWYNPRGNLMMPKTPNIIIETMYSPPSTRSGDFWVSTININSKDYSLGGNYTCNVNYNNSVSRVTVTVSVKGCMNNEYTCATGGGCIPCSMMCDGNNDCGDWSDEFGCHTASAPTCNNGTTV